MADAIRAEGLWKSFGSTAALKGVSLFVPKGSVYCIAGPNGSGKTTLLNILSRSLEPDRGRFEVNGAISYAHQNPMVFSDLTVSQNISVFSGMLGAKAEFAEETASLLGLHLTERTRAQDLSSGTKKRLEIAIALLPDPDILMLDEPTTGLDQEGTRGLLKFIKKASGKKTLLLATHQLSDLEGICTRLLVLRAGEGIFEGNVGSGLEKAYNRALGAKEKR